MINSKKDTTASMKCRFLLATLLLVSDWGHASSSSSSSSSSASSSLLFGFGRTNRVNNNNNETTTTTTTTSTTNSSSSDWTSYWTTVDPSKILLLMIHQGGLLMPKSVQKELRNAAKVCHVDSANLNVVERSLVLTNFTVASSCSSSSKRGGGKNNNKTAASPALRIGRVEITWDSYLQPCIDICVENVDVLVEFLNLLMTRNNWNELKEEAGFPPDLAEYQSSPTASTFVRVGRLDLSGRFRAILRSGPLDRELCPPFALDFKSMKELSRAIQRASQKAKTVTNRPGVTTEQLYEILQEFFTTAVKNMLASSAYDLLANQFQEDDTPTVREGKKLLADVSAAIVNYATDVGQTTTDRLQSHVVDRLEKLGLPRARSQMALLRQLGTNMTQQVTIPDKPLVRIRNALQSTFSWTKSVVKNKKKKMQQRGVKTRHGDIWFPDFP